jgi:hypothetical protein
VKEDIRWWVKGLEVFHGFTKFDSDIPLPSHVFSTDACLEGGGGHYLSDWFFVDWVKDVPEAKDCHINVLELLTVKIAVERWGVCWGGGGVS